MLTTGALTVLTGSAGLSTTLLTGPSSTSSGCTGLFTGSSNFISPSKFSSTLPSTVGRGPKSSKFSLILLEGLDPEIEFLLRRIGAYLERRKEKSSALSSSSTLLISMGTLGSKLGAEIFLLLLRLLEGDSLLERCLVISTLTACGDTNELVVKLLTE